MPDEPEFETAATRSDYTIVPAAGANAFAALPEPGYQLGEVIGHGGMGEVIVAQDQRIGREVAVKRIRGRVLSREAVARFMREARIQARLDHPAIVPVYELGTDADGRPYFTMKRLTGETLARRLADRAPIRPLLRAFVDVCLAIQLAHSRGVVHRDLKPSNIMLGDYGEVYVIDWGVARILAGRRSMSSITGTDEPSRDDAHTTDGAILGTPGYMAPEQVRGDDVTPAADVYALGAILFEILAGEALHPRGVAALATTLSEPQRSASARAPDRAIAPELDRVCVEALADEPGARPTARVLGEQVQAYLDGDRDLEQRRALALTQLAAARAALASDAPDARAEAMQRAGQALALDPESEQAATLVATLILEPPKQLPRSLLDSLALADLEFNARRSRIAMWAFASLFLFLPVFPLIGVKSWPMLLGFYGVVSFGVFLSWEIRKTGRTRLVVMPLMVGLLMVMFSEMLGPFILSPIVACGVLISISAIPSFTDHPRVVTAFAAVGLLLPFVLEWTGLLPPTYSIQPGAVVSMSHILSNRGQVLDHVVLIFADVAFVLITGWTAFAINGSRRQAQRELHIREWHLRQLLPTETGRPWQTRR